MKKFRRIKILVAVLFLSLSFGAQSLFGQGRCENDVFATMIFNFTKYIQWPDETEAGDFVIGIWGDEEIYKSLKAYDCKLNNINEYSVQAVTNPLDVSGCDVVFISPAKNKEFEGVKSLASGKPMLTVMAAVGYGKG